MSPTSNDSVAAEHACRFLPPARSVRRRSGSDATGGILGIIVSVALHGSLLAYAGASHGRKQSPSAPVRIEYIAAAPLPESPTPTTGRDSVAGSRLPLRSKRGARRRPKMLELPPPLPFTAPPEQEVLASPPEEGPVATGGGPPNAVALASVGGDNDPDLPSAAPSLQNAPMPHYPSWARQSGISGKMSLKLLVSASGEVVRVLVATSSGNPLLDEEAVKALAAWRFRPALRNGLAVESWVIVPVEFVLE